MNCVACEDNPKVPNIPCAVCGSYPITDAPEWIRLAQDGNGFHGGFWTNAAATEGSPKYYREDLFLKHQRGHENCIRAIGKLLRLCDDNGLGDKARELMEVIEND